MKPPKSIQSEKAVIGGLLLDSKLFSDIKTKLCTEDFTHRVHKSIFHIMGILFEEHNGFDAPLVAQRLPFLERTIYELANECASTKNILAYVDIVREKSVQRQLIAVASEIAQSALNPGEKDFRKVLDDAEAKVMSISDEYQGNTCPAQEHLTLFLRELAEEIASANLDEEYIRETIVEVNKALVSTLEHFEENHIEIEQKE